MRTRLVFWGKTTQDEQVLLAFKLNEQESNVDVYIFPKSSVTPEFEKELLSRWRKGREVTFPEPNEQLKMPLSITDSLIPEGYIIDRDDLLKRAQTEWQFIVLSSRLYHSYLAELQDLKDRFAKITQFDRDLYEELKVFWNKVHAQAREKNLFRDHADKIRKQTDMLFAELKKMREVLDKEFRAMSETHLASFQEKLVEVEKNIEENLNFNGIFQELKEIQRSFKKTRFTREHRDQLWPKIDGLFKKIKEKKYGPGATRKHFGSSLERRYAGLKEAIIKMERSIKRDREDLQFESQKLSEDDGSLESQLREAKVKMISDRVTSKEEKLKEMKNTQQELQIRLEKLKKKQEERDLQEKLKKEIKDKIAQEIKEAEKARESDSTLKEKILQHIDSDQSTTLEEDIVDGVEDVIDTIKAVAVVVENNFAELFSSVREEVKAIFEEE